MEDSAPDAPPPAGDWKTRRDAAMVRRAPIPLRVAMGLVAGVAVVIPLKLGLPLLAGLGLLLLVALGVSSSLVDRVSWFRRSTHALYTLALGVVVYAVFVLGVPPVITVYFPSVMLLGAAHFLGVRGALLWGVPLLGLVAAGVFLPLPPERPVPAGLVFATRAGTVLTILGFAVSFRQAHDRQSRELEERAETDALTGLANRRELDRALVEALDRSERFERRGAVVFLDVDGMKRVNDRFGHVAGDALLREVASRIEAITRSVDTPARLGGDEFVILLSEFDDPKGGEIFARKLLGVLRRPYKLEGLDVLLSASVGVALFPEASRDARSLLRKADESMYAAKRAGGDAIRLCDGEGMREVA